MSIIERLSADDLTQLAADVGPVREQVGAVVVLDAGEDFDPARAVALVGERLAAVPRFRQTLRRTPLGCGRPIWVDDPGFDVTRHVGVCACRPPGDEVALLAEAVAVVTEPLPGGRPRWRAVVVTGLAGHRAAVVVAFHHVLSDGIGGLAVLQRLVDGPVGEPGRAPAPPAPRPAPTRRQLAAQAWAVRLRAARRLPVTLRALRDAVTELRRAGAPRASASSLNQPTGSRRRMTVARTDLEGLRAAARAHGASINDAVLAAVAGALCELARRRGEPTPALVASVPVARRSTTTATDLGNHLGGMVVPLPADLDPAERLARTAAVTGPRKAAYTRADLLVGPMFRLMAALRLASWFMNRQHLVSTFVTDLRGPRERLRLAGRPVTEILPVAHLTGNVTVTFAALSYAGELVVTVTGDPDACPDLESLAALLRGELVALTAL